MGADTFGKQVDFQRFFLKRRGAAPFFSGMLRTPAADVLAVGICKDSKTSYSTFDLF
jgi:hypothetical protein